jgi:hypothetical protein
MESSNSISVDPEANTFQAENINPLPHLQELKDAVYRLLKYAVSDANRNVDENIINRAAPILQKNVNQFSADDEKTLWYVYNKLSQLVTPATNESLWLKEQMELDDRAQAEGKSGDYSFVAKAYKKTYASFKWIGYLFSIIFFLLQSYTVILSDSLKQVEQYYVELSQVEAQMLAVKQASPDISPCTSPLKELNSQENQLLLRIDSHYRVMQKLSSAFWGYFYVSNTLDYYVNQSARCETEMLGRWLFDNTEQQARSERSTFFEGAKSTLRLCNYLVLPLILGTLGSVAYVIRSILDSFSQASLTFASHRRGGMRVYLGALLGLISGVIIAPDLKDMQQISYSPLLWAFLMGYSVEFAFTFFDSLIARGRNALQTIKVPTGASKETPPEDKVLKSTIHDNN